MKPPRSALPLPRHVLRKRLKSGKHGYFFNIPTKFRRAGCAMRNEPLGVDYADAVQRAETILLPALDAWRTGDAAARHRKPSPGRSIGCSLSIERTAASPSSTPRPDATMRPVSSWLADTFSRMDAVSAKRASLRSPPPSPTRSTRRCCRSTTPRAT